MIEFSNLKRFEPTKVYGGISTFSFWFMGNQSNVYESMSYGNMGHFDQFQLTLSCRFQFNDFPFDSHVCQIEYGDYFYAIQRVTMDSASVIYGNDKQGINSYIVLNNLPFPFEFKLQALPAFVKSDPYFNYSFTGIQIRLERNSLELLLSSYFFPTGSFALVSMVSFLINPEIVSTN